jgi:hypothetical protein
MMQLQKDCRKPCSSVGVLSFSLHNIQNSAHKQPAGGGGSAVVQPVGGRAKGWGQHGAALQEHGKSCSSVGCVFCFTPHMGLRMIRGRGGIWGYST